MLINPFSLKRSEKYLSQCKIAWTHAGKRANKQTECETFEAIRIERKSNLEL